MEAGVVDLISQVHQKLTVQLEARLRDMEAATYCSVFLLRRSDTVTEMQSADRAHNELVTKQPSVERGSPHIWFFTVLLRGREQNLATKNSARIPTLRESGSGEDTQGDRRRPAAAKVACLGQSVEALPNLRKA